MANILVKGNVATVTIIQDPIRGTCHLSCSQGAWCAAPEHIEVPSLTIADAVNAAEIHVDNLEPQNA